MLTRILLCVCILLTPAAMLLFTGFFVKSAPEDAAGDAAAEAREKSLRNGRAQKPFFKIWKWSAWGLLLLSLALTLPFLGGGGTGLALMGVLSCIVQSLALLMLLFAWKREKARTEGAARMREKKT